MKGLIDLLSRDYAFYANNSYNFPSIAFSDWIEHLRLYFNLLMRSHWIRTINGYRHLFNVASFPVICETNSVKYSQYCCSFFDNECTIIDIN